MVSKRQSFAGLVMVGALYLTGCASAPTATARGMTVTPNDIVMTTAPAKLSRSVVVDDARNTTATNASKIDDTKFKEALVSSLERTGLLGGATEARYKISATILEVDQPWSFIWGWAPVVTVTSKIRYRVVDVKTDAVVLDEEVIAADKAHLRDALVGGRRAAIATERSARKSIATLIEKLKAKPLT